MSMPPRDPNPPQNLSTAISRSGFIQGEARDLLSIAIAKAKEECAENRRRVLAHPDLAKRLTQPPIGMSSTDMWNGWIPPEKWREAHNGSPVRRALVKLMEDVAHAERESDADPQHEA